MIAGAGWAAKAGTSSTSFHPLITGAVIAGLKQAIATLEATEVFPSPHYRGCDRGLIAQFGSRSWSSQSFHPLITGAVIAGEEPTEKTESAA